MDNKLKVLRTGFIKFFIFALTAFCCLLIVIGATHFDIARTGVISDSSFTECLQETLLLLCVCIFVYIAKKYKANGIMLVAGFVASMLIREWDAVFYRMFFHGAWKYIAIPIVLGSCYLAFREGKYKVIDDLIFFMQRKAYNIFLLGLTVVLVISRILGMRMVVTMFAGIHFNEGLKNFNEEGFELFGYLLMFLASCMFLLEYSKLNSKNFNNKSNIIP